MKRKKVSLSILTKEKQLQIKDCWWDGSIFLAWQSGYTICQSGILPNINAIPIFFIMTKLPRVFIQGYILCFSIIEIIFFPANKVYNFFPLNRNFLIFYQTAIPPPHPPNYSFLHNIYPCINIKLIPMHFNS